VRQLRYMPRKRIDNRPVRRRRSVRSARRLTLAFILGFAVVLGMIFSGWVRWKQREIVVHINQLQSQKKVLLERRKQLNMELARLRAPARISRMAEDELGMVRSRAERITFVRDSTSADSEGSAAHEVDAGGEGSR